MHQGSGMANCRVTNPMDITCCLLNRAYDHRRNLHGTGCPISTKIHTGHEAHDSNGKPGMLTTASFGDQLAQNSMEVQGLCFAVEKSIICLPVLSCQGSCTAFRLSSDSCTTFLHLYRAACLCHWRGALRSHVVC